MELGQQLVAGARQIQACRILKSVPGVGAITATSFVTAIEDPENFRRSPRGSQCLVGPDHTMRYRSGEVQYDDHISHRGDRQMQGLLFVAATVVLTRSSAESGLRR